MHGYSECSNPPGTKPGLLTRSASRTLRTTKIAIAAHERGAVCITHDAEFTNRVKRRGFNSHIRLRCPEPDAVELVETHLDQIVDALGWGTVVIVVGRTKMNVFFAQWEN